MKKCPLCAEDIQDEAIKCKHCGSWLDGRAPEAPTAQTNSVEDEAKRLVDSGKKIEAIKLVREKKNLGLAEAKTFVEALESPEAAAKRQSSNRAGVGCLVVIAIIVGLAILGQLVGSPTTPGSSASSPPSSTLADLAAKVSFNGTQFVITNGDASDWTDVKFEINGGLFAGGYELKTPRIAAGSTVTVGALQFAKSDGTRFNPFQMKPQKFVITGRIAGKDGMYVGGW